MTRLRVGLAGSAEGRLAEGRRRSPAAAVPGARPEQRQPASPRGRGRTPGSVSPHERRRVAPACAAALTSGPSRHTTRRRIVETGLDRGGLKDPCDGEGGTGKGDLTAEPKQPLHVAHTGCKGNDEDTKSGMESFVCCQTHGPALRGGFHCLPQPGLSSVSSNRLSCFHKRPQLKPCGCPSCCLEHRATPDDTNPSDQLSPAGSQVSAQSGLGWKGR